MAGQDLAGGAGGRRPDAAAAAGVEAELALGAGGNGGGFYGERAELPGMVFLRDLFRIRGEGTSRGRGRVKRPVIKFIKSFGGEFRTISKINILYF